MAQYFFDVIAEANWSLTKREWIYQVSTQHGAKPHAPLRISLVT